MRENDGSAFALVDIGHPPALDFPELLSSERFCAIGQSFLLSTLRRRSRHEQPSSSSIVKSTPACSVGCSLTSKRCRNIRLRSLGIDRTTTERTPSPPRRLPLN